MERTESKEKEDKRTVFVRGLSFAVGDEQLEEVFSSIGPVKHAFLVKKKESGKHKGFGFVQFALEEDAVRAIQELNGTKLEGRTIKVESAQKRASFEERKEKKKQEIKKRGESDGKEEYRDGGGQSAVALREGTKHQRPKGNKEDALKKHQLVKTLAIGGLSPDEVAGAIELAKRAGQVEDVVQPAPSSVVRQYKLEQDGCSGDVVLVRYDSTKEMMKAMEKIHGEEVKLSQQKSAPPAKLWARQVSGEGRHLKRWRVVVRNLPFQATDGDLRESFSKAGFIWELSIPKSPEGRSRGFAFVGFTCKAHAEKAISLVNASKVAGRPVAVDWAISKREFETKDQDKMDAGGSEGIQTNDDDDEKKIVAGQELDDDVENEILGIDREKEKEIVHNVLDSILKGSDEEEEREKALNEVEESLHDDGSDSDRDGSNEEEEEEEEEGAKEASDLREEEWSGEDIMREEEMKHATVKALEDNVSRLKKILSQTENGTYSPVEPGATIFLRKVPLDATRPDLFASMKKFGPVRSCRIVVDKITGKPKGTAFIDFRSQEAATALAEASKKAREKKGPAIIVAGMPVEADIALGGDEIRDLAIKQSGERHADRRNIYLSKEGHIAEGSATWNQLSNSDKAKRSRAAEDASLKLKSPNFAVSRTRLNVRNVPRAWDEKQLKALFVEAVKERATKATPRVKQVKILRDKPATADAPAGASKGIAFIEFDDHEHSLCALRHLNNNPSIWGKDHRPIVEFAIDNVQALKKRAARLAKQQQGNPEGNSKPAGTEQDQKSNVKNKKENRAPAEEQEGGSKSKRQLRKERRLMLKQRARASQGKTNKEDRDDSAATTKMASKSQRRREQRKRKKGADTDDATPVPLPSQNIQITVPRKTSKHAAHQAIDMLANSESHSKAASGKKRKKKDVDEVEALALRHQKKFLAPGSKKSSAGKSKKRWFEDA